MKQTLLILALITSTIQTFAQSPRIKLNQITKDTVKGSVLISSPSDSGMVYSRDFYVAYGADTVLILYGDTLAATSGIISSVLSDGVTITGNGTIGNELKVDTLLIATIKALNDSLATISASTTPDGVTITGDGSVGNPLKVDTATVISTINGLVDTLTNRGYLTANQTITLSGDVTGSGTTAITATVVDDSHNHIISNVDFLQDSLNAKANDSDLSNYVTLSGAETITGAKTFTNTFTQSGGDVNFDSGTLFVDESANRVGIGTSTPTQKLEVSGNTRINGNLNLNAAPVASNFILNAYYGSASAMVNQFEHGLNQTVSFGFYNKQSTARDYGGYFQVNTDGTFSITKRSNNVDKVVIKIDNSHKILMPEVYGNTGSGNNLEITSTGELVDGGSSITIKKNISDYDKGLETIKKLRPIYFEYINDRTVYSQLHAGFIAEDFNEIELKEFLIYDEKGNPINIQYAELTSLLTKAIQEQQAIIETQQSEIDQLKNLITDLTNRLTILENK